MTPLEQIEQKLLAHISGNAGLQVEWLADPLLFKNPTKRTRGPRTGMMLRLPVTYDECRKFVPGFSTKSNKEISEIKSLLRYHMAYDPNKSSMVTPRDGTLLCDKYLLPDWMKPFVELYLYNRSVNPSYGYADLVDLLQSKLNVPYADRTPDDIDYLNKLGSFVLFFTPLNLDHYICYGFINTWHMLYARRTKNPNDPPFGVPSDVAVDAYGMTPHDFKRSHKPFVDKCDVRTLANHYHALYPTPDADIPACRVSPGVVLSILNTGSMTPVQIGSKKTHVKMGGVKNKPQRVASDVGLDTSQGLKRSLLCLMGNGMFYGDLTFNPHRDEVGAMSIADLNARLPLDGGYIPAVVYDTSGWHADAERVGKRQVTGWPLRTIPKRQAPFILSNDEDDAYKPFTGEHPLMGWAVIHRPEMMTRVVARNHPKEASDVYAYNYPRVVVVDKTIFERQREYQLRYNTKKDFPLMGLPNDTRPFLDAALANPRTSAQLIKKGWVPEHLIPYVKDLRTEWVVLADNTLYENKP